METFYVCFNENSSLDIEQKLKLDNSIERIAGRGDHMLICVLSITIYLIHEFPLKEAIKIASL